ncbi:MAG: Flagellar hook-length control protein FliK [Thermoleophilia bacterium]|nr:Flagellar hook-length control protein FliK [Thermoleophilia bacterium]
MIQGSTSNALPLAGVAPAAPTKVQTNGGRGDGAFGEALAGAHTVQDRNDARATSSRDDARGRSEDRTRGQERADEVRRTDRPERSERTERTERPDASDDAHEATPTATTEHDVQATTHEHTDTEGTATAGTETSEDDAAATAAPVVAANVSVTAGPIQPIVAAATTESTDAILVPTTVAAASVTTNAVDAAIRLAMGDATAPVAPDATDAAPAAAATTTTTTTAAAVTVAPELTAATPVALTDAEAAAIQAALQGTEDVTPDDAAAGQKSPLQASASTTTSGPTPAVQVEADAAAIVEGEQQLTQATVQKVATATTEAVSDGAVAQSAQLVSAATAEVDVDTEATVVDGTEGQVAKTATKAETTVAADAALDAEVVVEEPAVANARTAHVQQPTVAAAQAQAAAAAKVGAEASDEASDQVAPTPRPAEPLATAQPLSTTARTDQAAQSLRAQVAETSGLQDRIDHIAEQLATRLRLSHAAGGSEVNLSLRPRELGEVTVQMKVREGVVAATVLVDRAETLGTLSANIEELKRSLEQQGLTVQEFSVGVRGESGASTSQDSSGNGRSNASTSAATGLAGAAAANPGLSGDREVEPEEVHDGNVSVLA